ncbi:MAG: hypothetical protein GXO23_02005 [Crenarchaeota archaeon]|nr:hypothetical protein [Thermoproteota archaeon]
MKKVRIIYEIYKKDKTIDIVAVGKKKIILKKRGTTVIVEADRDRIRITCRGEELKDRVRQIVSIIEEIKDQNDIILITYRRRQHRLKICIERYPREITERVKMIINKGGRCREYKNDTVLLQDLINLVFTSRLRNVATIIEGRVIRKIRDIENIIQEHTEKVENKQKRTIIDYLQDPQH